MTRPRSYYGRPVLKAPVWTSEIPVYFFAGGMAGASARLALRRASCAGNERARAARVAGRARPAIGRRARRC